MKNLPPRRARVRPRFAALMRNFAPIAMLALVACLSISLLYGDRLWKQVEREVDARNMDSLKQRLEVVEQIMQELRGLAYTISTDDNIRRFAITPRIAAQITLTQKVRELAKTYKNALSYVENVILYSTASGYVADAETLRALDAELDARWLERLDAADRHIQLFPSKRRSYYPYYITILCPIWTQGDVPTGAVVLDVNIENLGDAIGDVGAQDERLLLFDKDMRLYYHSVHRLLGELDEAPEFLRFALTDTAARTVSLEAEGARYIVSHTYSARNEWYAVLMTPTQYYTSYHSNADRFVRDMLLLAIAAGGALAVGLAAYSRWPLKRILRFAGEDAAPAPIGEEEARIVELIGRFQRESVRGQEAQRERMRSLNEAQMQALQSQIHPHFLYNALDFMHWMAIRQFGGENEVSDMAKTLAFLLRESVRKDYLVCVEEELRYVQMYLGVYASRYRDKFSLSVEVTEAARRCEIIRLLLQPLAENAMKHGLRPRRYAGNIVIRGAVEGDELLLSVEDDGVGLRAEDAARIEAALAADADDGGSMGLRNVQRRIHLVYGAQYGVRLTVGPAGGAKACLRLPVREAQNTP